MVNTPPNMVFLVKKYGADMTGAQQGGNLARSIHAFSAAIAKIAVYGVDH
jgi:hypothetical protein